MSSSITGGVANRIELTVWPKVKCAGCAGVVIGEPRRVQYQWLPTQHGIDRTAQRRHGADAMPVGWASYSDGVYCPKCKPK